MILDWLRDGGWSLVARGATFVWRAATAGGAAGPIIEYQVRVVRPQHRSVTVVRATPPLLATITRDF